LKRKKRHTKDIEGCKKVFTQDIQKSIKIFTKGSEGYGRTQKDIYILP